jgi:hypothetical protein
LKPATGVRTQRGGTMAWDFETDKYAEYLEHEIGNR